MFTEDGTRVRKARIAPTKAADSLTKNTRNPQKKEWVKLMTRYFPSLKEFCVMSDHSENRLRAFFDDPAPMRPEEEPYVRHLLTDIWELSHETRTWEYLFTGKIIDRESPRDDSDNIRITGTMINDAIIRHVRPEYDEGQNLWGYYSEFIAAHTDPLTKKPVYGRNFLLALTEADSEILFRSFVLNKHDAALRVKDFLIYMNIISKEDLEEVRKLVSTKLSRCPFFEPDDTIADFVIMDGKFILSRNLSPEDCEKGYGLN